MFFFIIYLFYDFRALIKTGRNSKQYCCTNFSCVFSSELYINLEYHELKSRQEKKQHGNRNGKRNENMTSTYSSQLLRVEWGPSDVVYQEDGSHTPAPKATSKVQHDDGCVLERSFAFVTEFEHILLRVLEQGERRIASELAYLLTDT